MSIHPTAVIEEGVEIDTSVAIGPYAVIRKGVKIGAGTTVDAHTVIEGKTTIGKNNLIGIGVVIGNPPQDLKYRGEDTEVIIGDDNIIREYVTINRGTTAGGKTVIGNNVLLMSYVHIAHDAIIGDEAVLANCVTLAGHITIEEQAIIGGLTPIHQFVRIGRLSIIGGDSKVTKDILPFSKTAGNPLRVYGLNNIGLKRKNYSEEDTLQLKKVYKLLFSSNLNTTQAIEKIENDSRLNSDQVKYIVEFIKNSSRGICKNRL